MTLSEIVNLIYLIIIAVATCSTVILTIFAWKTRKSSKGTSEEFNQLNDQNFFIKMLERMVTYLTNAEEVYKAFKGTTDKYGEMKLNDVLTKIQSDYIAEGKVFDGDKWKSIIDYVIKMTKVVNNDENVSG